VTISIDWAGTHVIYVPKADMVQIAPPPREVRRLDMQDFRMALRDLEDSPDGRPWPQTHLHDTETTLAGMVYARKIKILEPYTVTFEDGQYAVDPYGANHNLADVMNLNQVSLRSANSAGLIVVIQGSGITEQDKLDIADRVLDEAVAEHTGAGTLGDVVDDISAVVDATATAVGNVASAVADVDGDVGAVSIAVGSVATAVSDVHGDVVLVAAGVEAVDGAVAAVKDDTADLLADTAELLVRLSIARAANLDALPNIEAQATLARQILKNDLKLVPGTTNNWVLMNDAGTEPMLRWHVTGPTGSAIVVPVDAPAWRRLSALP